MHRALLLPARLPHNAVMQLVSASFTKFLVTRVVHNCNRRAAEREGALSRLMRFSQCVWVVQLLVVFLPADTPELPLSVDVRKGENVTCILVHSGGCKSVTVTSDRATLPIVGQTLLTRPTSPW